MKQAPPAYRACILAADSASPDATWALHTLGGYNHSLLAICAHSIKASGIQRISVAGGGHDAAFRAAAERLELRTLPAPDKSQTSLTALLPTLSDFLQDQDCPALLLLPVRLALVRAVTIRNLLQMAERIRVERHTAPTLRPSFLEQAGYPLLLSRHHARAILEQKNRPDLRDYLSSLRHLRLRPQWLSDQKPLEVEEGDLVELPLADIGSIWQLSTEEELDRAEDYLCETEGRSLPGLEEARHLLAHANLPRIKMRHSVLVALGALRLGVALAEAKEKALPCDSLLSHVGAGLLHDLVRYQRRHAEAGARLLWRMGWPKVALAAGRHQQLPSPCLDFLGLRADPRDESPNALPFPAQPDNCLLSATLCVNMADKYTQDDRQVPLDTRFARVGRNCGQDPDARAAIHRRKEQSRAVASLLQQCCGHDPLSIIARPSGHELEAPLLALFQNLQGDQSSSPPPSTARADQVFSSELSSQCSIKRQNS